MAQPEAVAPAATVPGQPQEPPTPSRARSSRRSPPRLKSAPPPPALASVSFEQLMQTYPALGRGFSDLASQTRDHDRPKLTACVRQLVARVPEQVKEDTIAGAVAIRLDVKAGLARATDVRPLREGDAEFARCMAESRSFMQQEFEVPNTPDGTIDLEWSYRFGL